MCPRRNRKCGIKIDMERMQIYTSLRVNKDTMLTDLLCPCTTYPNTGSSLSEMVDRIHTSSEMVDPNTFLRDYKRTCYCFTGLLCKECGIGVAMCTSIKVL